MTTSIAAAIGTWSAAHDLPTPAAWYGQHDGPVLLDDDTVLVAGGADATGSAIPDAAVFTPASGAGTGGDWVAADAMHTPRRLHSLTRLADGTVLAVGGLNGSAGVQTAELYHPDSHHWTPAGQLETARWGHSAVLLQDGSVLVTGGSAARTGGGTTALRSAEHYTPDHGGEWHTVAAMTDARTGHTAVLLSGGVVLVAGGVAPTGAVDDPALAFCELYTVGKNSWTPTGNLQRARRHHRATRLSDRTVLVTGGTAPGSPGAAPFDPFSQRTVELYNLDTGAWTTRAEMPSGRAFHRAVAFGVGQVLVVGGAASDRDEAGYRSGFVYDIAGNSWAPAAGLTTGRWSFAATALADDRVLVTGGVARSGLAAADPAALELAPTTELFDGRTP